MKFWKFLLLLFFWPVGHGFSQDSTSSVFRLSNLPPEGVILDKGWKFQSGDNPEYAKPEYDDSRWQAINPTLDIDSLPASVRSGICWLRLHLNIDSNLIAEPLTFLIMQFSATEIYINGQLLKRFGRIAENPKQIIAYNPYDQPVTFIFKEQSEQLIAVRFVIQPEINYPKVLSLGTPLHFINVNKTDALYNQFRFLRGFASSVFFRLGLFLLLVILHFAYFLYYPPQKANLFISFYALFTIAGDAFQLNTPREVWPEYYFLNLTVLLWNLGHFFLLTAIYYLLNVAKRWNYWCIFAIVILSIILNAWGSPFYSQLVTFSIPALIAIEIIRLAWKSARIKRRGAWILVIGGSSQLIFSLTFALGYLTGYAGLKISENLTISDLTYNLAYLSIPISTSILLGLEFAFTNRTLTQKLAENEILSAQTIAQEQEKQQILSTQKDLLEKQVEERTAQLSNSLKELKGTQAQLIQSEKMASLGELTAGIAHEIQNPLNFVNNFSEVNRELIGEIKESVQKGNLQNLLDILGDLEHNMDKINSHGQRAGSIVKSMLQHSRTSTGQKEASDINAVCEEYLRLAYHGMRARDKSFHAELKTDFDPSIRKLNIIPQDIGRVLLNLYNNAFYACTERSRSAAAERSRSAAAERSRSTVSEKLQRDLPHPDGSENVQGEGSYKPRISVTTRKKGDYVEIRVEDNGIGIPDSIKDKIFQPFYTTKPTGQGTGLGLSLAYDIIRAHGGELKVNSQLQEGATFIITLPI